MMFRKCVAEAIGTFWLTFAGCGSAVIAAGFPEVGIGLLGVSFAFGLTVLTMAYAIGHVSGCHLNPAVTLGLAAGGRFPSRDIGPYVAAQVIGAVVAAALLYAIASGSPAFDLAKGFAANGYGEHSPGKYGLVSGFLAEVVLTMMFLFVIMGATDAHEAIKTMKAIKAAYPHLRIWYDGQEDQTEITDDVWLGLAEAWGLMCEWWEVVEMVADGSLTPDDQDVLKAIDEVPLIAAAVAHVTP
jgi:glycerol uptake facilitator-like aquaporin